MSALIVSGRSNDEASEKALEDIRTKVVPFLGIPQGSQVIAQVAEKHHLSIERVIQIAKNMKKRDGK